MGISQKAAVALDILPMLEAEAKERQREAGGDHGNQHTGGKVAVNPRVDEPPTQKQPQVIEQAAKIVGVNKQYIQDMKTISRDAPLLHVIT